jgi:hypothetical protein
VLQPLKRDAKESKKPVLSLKELLEVFSNIEHIWSVHLRLIDGLKDRMQNYNEKTMLGDILLESVSVILLCLNWPG